MSFVLDYRKNELTVDKPAKAPAPEVAERAVETPARPAEPRRAHRLSVLGALLIAGLVLAVFNSGGLVNYAYDFSQSAVGMRALELTEKWHGLMQERKMTNVVDSIRHAVMTARQTTWEDLWLAAWQTAENTAPDGAATKGEMGGDAETPRDALGKPRGAEDAYVSAADRTRP